MGERAKRYLELVKAEDTHKAGPGERGGKHGLVHENGTKCDAENTDGCPEEKRSERSDRDIVRGVYAQSRKYSGGRLPKGHMTGLGNTTHFDSTKYARQEFADAIRETGLNPNQFAITNGMPQQEIASLLNGSMDPTTVRKTDGRGHYRTTWTGVAQRVSALLGKDPSELFPEEAKSITQIDDAFEGDTVRTPAWNAERGESLKMLQAALKTLSPSEQKVIEMRFGLGRDAPMSVLDVGRAFDVSQERVRQIEAKALRKLRHSSRSGFFADYGGGSFDDEGSRQPARQVGIEREPTVDTAAGLGDKLSRR